MVAPAKPAGIRKENWIPDRQDAIWINCNPQACNEMKDLHPFLVLSPRIFNEQTSLVVGLPMTTAEYNCDNPFAVGNARGRKAEMVSYVLCHQPKSFNWHSRKAAPHPLKRPSDHHFAECCARLNQIVQLAP